MTPKHLKGLSAFAPRAVAFTIIVITLTVGISATLMIGKWMVTNVLSSSEVQSLEDHHDYLN